MTTALSELKTRARLRLNASRRGGAADAGKLKDCLNAVARAAGFTHWEHARRVLGGEAAPGEDLGRFWHAPRCSVLLNHWYAREAEARARQAALPGAFLLPYGRQFVVAQDEYVRELGLDPAEPAWVALRRDLVAGYGSPAWQVLCAQRLRAPPATFS